MAILRVADTLNYCLRILLSCIFRSEANDLALRIARQHTDAEDMIIVDR